jgi:hypothetical protein
VLLSLLRKSWSEFIFYKQAKNQINIRYASSSWSQ